MAELPASTEITAPLVRRRRAGKAAIVIVSYAGQKAPPHLVRDVEAELGSAGLKMAPIGLGDLAPNPVARLAELRERSGTDVFSIDCDAAQLKYGTLISALNLHRNTFARQELCAIFWITAPGMQSFARHASNFLDFRTRLIEVDAEGQPLHGQPSLEAARPRVDWLPSKDDDIGQKESAIDPGGYPDVDFPVPGGPFAGRSHDKSEPGEIIVKPLPDFPSPRRVKLSRPLPNDPDELATELMRENHAPSERAQVYEQVPDLVDDPERTLALLNRLRRETSNGNDLYFLDLSIVDVARRWPEYREKAADLRERLYDHIAEPPEHLFRWIETQQDGRVDFWREIPAGQGWKGSLNGEGPDDERPRHRVTVISPFIMAAGPVTNAQYAAFDPSHEAPAWEAIPPQETDHHPAVNVTWYEATSFCRWLGAACGWAPGARLPSEAEWEYACRACTETRYWCGNRESDLSRVGWYDANSEWRTHRVAEKFANPWGLYDIHGNVSEWTASPWSGDYSGCADGQTVDPSASLSEGSETPREVGRVIRGGGYGDGADRCRSAYRKEEDPAFESRDVGFRVVLPSAPYTGIPWRPS